MLRSFRYKSTGTDIIIFRIFKNKLLAMGKEEQHSPFIHKGPQITPLSSLPLRGAELPY